MNLKDLHIDGSWTLFLDRDGVINKRIVDGYVKSPGEFEFLPGVLDAMHRLSKVFNRIIIVTNQQGIGKGLMSEEELEVIHQYLTDTVHKEGGKIDAIYHAPGLAEEKSAMRKPGIGMALQAKKDFPEIDFKNSIMLGDSAVDMEFGRRAGMVTVMVGIREDTKGHMGDFTFNSLRDFCEALDL